MMKAKQFADKEVRERYRAMFAEEGIGENRLSLRARVPGKQDHLALYDGVDIGLDPFPYNGTTTTCEALWMGVPVVTLAGDRHSGRVGASILQCVDLDELVAASVDGYIMKAVSLAREPERLQELRAAMRQRLQSSPLLDDRLFTGQLEKAYQWMWHKYWEKSKH
jgi:predicted O-linked N-acetylglucosamine transferase (SPINDLY family)